MIYFFIIILTFVTCESFAQVYSSWLERYDGISTNVSAANDIVVDSLRNIYVLGKNGSSSGNGDITLLKYNQFGDIVWVKKYNGPGNGNDLSNGLKISGKNIYVTGCSAGKGSGVDYVTIKYDSTGLQEWVQRYTYSDGNFYDASYALAIDDSENVYVTGESKNPTTNTIDCVTIKYNSSGQEQWLSRYITNNAIGYAIVANGNGDVFVTGRDNGKYFTIKYNSVGDQKWVAFYNGGSDNSPNAISLDRFGNVFVAGVSHGIYWDYATVKYDSLGVEKWVRRYNGTDNYMDQLNAMIIDNSGNVYVTGNGTELGRGYDYVTIKYNNSGDQQWIVKYHNGLNDIAKAIKIDEIGNIYVTGASDGSNSHFDYATVKYDSSGNQKWVIRYNTSSAHDDEALAMDVDNLQNVYVTGISYIWGQQHYDIITIKYSQTATGVIPINIGSPAYYLLKQNYPNPFNPNTIIYYDLPAMSYTSLKVFDVLGNEVATLVDEKKWGGKYKVEFDGTKLPSGIYFYRLISNGNIIDTKKMILLK